MDIDTKRYWESAIWGKEEIYDIYRLSHGYGDNEKTTGYFGNWEKAKSVIKKYWSSVQGFKDYSNELEIEKMKVNEDDID